MTKSDRINIRLEPDLKAKLETLAKAERRSISSMAEVLIAKALDAITVAA